MRILIAEDDPASLRLLEMVLTKWNHEVVSTTNGLEVLARLRKEDAPSLLILDWMMPGATGLDVCRELRQTEQGRHTYVILLTARADHEDIVAGLSAGADDYLTKPFDHAELRARIHVGERVLRLQDERNARVKELESALSNVKVLRGLLPICCYCKKIRQDEGYWQQVEGYVGERSGAEFSHGICPDCAETIVRPQLEELHRRIQAGQ